MKEMTDMQVNPNEATRFAMAKLEEWLPQMDGFLEFLDGLDQFWGQIEHLDGGSLVTDLGVEVWRDQASGCVQAVRESVHNLKAMLMAWKSEEDGPDRPDRERLDSAVRTLNELKQQYDSFVTAESGLEVALELCVAAGYRAIADGKDKGWNDIWGTHAVLAKKISERLGGKRAAEDRDILDLKHGSNLSIGEIKLALYMANISEASLGARISRLQDRVTQGLILELTEANGVACGFEIGEPNNNRRYGNTAKETIFKSPSGKEVTVLRLEVKTNRFGGMIPACFDKLLDELRNLELIERDGERDAPINVLAMMDIKYGILRFYNAKTRKVLLAHYDEVIGVDGDSGAETARKSGWIIPPHGPSSDPDRFVSDIYDPGEEPKESLLEVVEEYKP